MREIVIDTETTGLDPLNGDHIVKIGAVELAERLGERLVKPAIGHPPCQPRRGI
jgi:DNA polymerase III epsilon subunit-like protein